MPEQAATSPKRRMIRRTTYVLCGLVLALALVFVLAGPRIAAGLTPWLAEKADIPGRIEVRSVAYTWRGELSIGQADLYDPEGALIASVSARTKGGLLGLLDGDLESDLALDGWASITTNEDGTTNIEGALGLERGAETQEVEEVAREGESAQLPPARLILSGLDVAFTRFGSPTLALAGVNGTIETGGQRVGIQLNTSLKMPAAVPQSREQIAQSTGHGTVAFEADLSLADLSGEASATVDGLTSEAAEAFGVLAGSESIARAAAIAAEGGFRFDTQAILDAGLPQVLSFEGGSNTIAIELDIQQRDGRIELVEPGSIRVDAESFLADDTLRRVLLPGEGVQANAAGAITIDFQRLVLPALDGSVQWAEASAAMLVEVGDTELLVPGLEAEPVRLRLEGSTFEIDAPGTGTIGVEAGFRAAVNDERPGELRLEGQAIIEQLASLAQSPVSPGAIASAAPGATVSIERMPTVAIEPWLGVLRRAGLNPLDTFGPFVDAKATWLAANADAAAISLSIESQGVTAVASGQWSSGGLALDTPARVRSTRPNAILNAWMPDDWDVLPTGEATLDIREFAISGEGFALRLDSVESVFSLSAENITIRRQGQRDLGVEALELQADARGESTSIALRATPLVGQHPARVVADLSTSGVRDLMRNRSMPPLIGTVSVDASSQALEFLGIETAGRPLHAWVHDAFGADLDLAIDLVEPTDGALLAAGISLTGENATIQIEAANLWAGRIALDGAMLTAMPTPELWDAIAPLARAEGTTLASVAPLVVEAGASTFSFASGGQWTDGLESMSVSLVTEGDLRIDKVPLGTADETGNQQRADAVIAELSASVNSLGKALSGGSGLAGELGARIESPGRGPVAVIQGTVASDKQGAIDAELVLDELDAAMVAGLAGLGDRIIDAISGSLGDGGQITARASAVGGAGGRPWSLREASVDIQTQRLQTAAPIAVDFRAETIALTEPITLAWTPDSAWLEEAIGAGLVSEGPIEIAMARIERGNPLSGEVALLDPASVFIDAAVRGTGVELTIPDRPTIDLATIEARARRTGLSTYAITANARPTDGGTLELNSLLQKPAGETGRLSLATAVLRGTLKGDDIPVSLVDAMSNTDGLLTDSLGPMVDLDAELTNGRFVPRRPPSADLRFSIRGPRADASGYGRLEDRVISMPEPQTILTVREVGPEVAARFSQLIPELLIVEKRPEDGPAIVRTEGLAIPTNGQWSKGQGKATIALGKARFNTTALLGGVLKAAGQRAEGQIGRRIAPFEVRMTNGIIEYPPFTLPLGDFSIESEGTVNLVDETMNVLVWLPTAALSDEAAGNFNTGLGSALGRTIPGFGSVTTVPWRVTGPLAQPTIRPAPRVLIERRGDELLGPLLRPGQTLQDILGLPTRQDRKEGGG